MNNKLRDDNNSENCTVEGVDPYPKAGRKHTWRWEHENSRIRVCTTCLRSEDVSKTKPPGARGVSP